MSRDFDDGFFGRPRSEDPDFNGFEYAEGIKKAQPPPEPEPAFPTLVFNPPAPTAPASAAAGFGYLILFAIGLLLYLISAVVNGVHSLVLKTATSVTNFCEPRAFSFDPKTIALHSFDVYAGYAPGYESWLPWIEAQNFPEQERIQHELRRQSYGALRNREWLLSRQEFATLHELKKQGTGNPSLLALGGAAWKLCLANQCSEFNYEAANVFLHYLSDQKRVPEAQFDLAVLHSGSNPRLITEGRSEYERKQVRNGLANMWAYMRKVYPENRCIAAVARSLDPGAHGFWGWLYLRALAYQQRLEGGRYL
jgi:hypothetical protein